MDNELMYNSDNDEYVVAKMDEIAPANDTECKHETLIPEPDDTIGNAVYHGCANLKCGLGFYIQQK